MKQTQRNAIFALALATGAFSLVTEARAQSGGGQSGNGWFVPGQARPGGAPAPSANRPAPTALLRPPPHHFLPYHSHSRRNSMRSLTVHNETHHGIDLLPSECTPASCLQLSAPPLSLSLHQCSSTFHRKNLPIHSTPSPYKDRPMPLHRTDNNTNTPP